MADSSTIDSWDAPPCFPVPLDVLFDIFSHLSLKDVLILRRTCKAFFATTRLRSIWALLYRTHVLEKNVPVPGIDSDTVESMSADQLEDCVRRALTLRRNWSSPAPQKTRQLNFVPTADPNSRNIFLQFLPARSNRWLMSITMCPSPRKFSIQCWDVAVPEPRCVAELIHVEGPFGGIAINSDPTSPAIVAMQFAQTEIFTIDFEADEPESAFETLAAVDGVRELHALKGSTLVTRYPDGDVCVWNLGDLEEDPEQESFRLRNPVQVQVDKCQAVHVSDDCVIIIRTTTLEIYPLAPRSPNVTSTSPLLVFPIAQYRWQWKTDSVYVAEQVSYHTTRANKPAPINVFVRFNSGFPWPVNLLHHFSLTPNPMYTRERHTCAANLPYFADPRHVQSFGSPVRLFATSSVALGRYGTALWTDSHTEDRFVESHRGQRLAGAIANWQDEEESGAPPMVKASMVFEVIQDDAWTRIAMVEETGKIALGGVDGDITMLEYS